MDEKVLRTRLRNEWKPCHITAIEGAYSYGMPDLHVTVENGRAWIELKQNYSGRLIFKANQLSWMEREYQLGADTWIIWFDIRLRVCTYVYLRDWVRTINKEKISVKIIPDETFTGTFQEVKNIIFGVYIQEKSQYNSVNIHPQENCECHLKI